MAATYEGFTFSGHNTSSDTYLLSASQNRWMVIFACNEAIGAGVTYPTGCTFDGNAATQVGSGIISPDDQIKSAASTWVYEVPTAMSGTKTIAITGGSGRPQFYAIEISGCGGYGDYTTTTGNDAYLELTDVLATSICLDSLVNDGVFQPSIVETTTQINAGSHNDGDNRYDLGWGTGREAGTGTVAMGWNTTTSTRTYVMIEMLTSAAVPSSMVYPRGEGRISHYVSALYNQDTEVIEV